MVCQFVQFVQKNKNKRIISMLKKISLYMIVVYFITIIISCKQSSYSRIEEFTSIYDLPKDFAEAVKYIESEIVDEYEKRSAYYQLIVENPQSYYYDFNSKECAPEYSTSPDGLVRIYSFYYDSYRESPQILQFKNSQGRIITTHLTTKPLEKMDEGMAVKKVDYTEGFYTDYAEIIGQIEINGIVTYLVHILNLNYYDFVYNKDVSGTIGAFITGMQLTKKGYKYISIFNNPSLGSIHYYSPDGMYDRIRTTDENADFLSHGDIYYDDSEEKLYLPIEYDNEAEQFITYKWNESNQSFEIDRTRDCFNLPPSIHHCIGKTNGLEIVMYFGDLLLRVDKMDYLFERHGIRLYRYASWNKGKTMKDKPDLVINEGELDDEDGTIHFINGDYEYIVPCADNKYNNKLIVKQSGKTILIKTIKRVKNDY